MDNLGTAVAGFFVLTSALWQALAVVVVVALGYAVLSMVFRHGVGAWRQASSRRRAAKRSIVESKADS